MRRGHFLANKIAVVEDSKAQVTRLPEILVAHRPLVQLDLHCFRRYELQPAFLAHHRPVDALAVSEYAGRNGA